MMRSLRYKPSTFFHNFSMGEMVKRNKSHLALECSGGAMGGGGGGNGFHSTAEKVARYHRSDSFACRLKAEVRGTGDEAEFMASLKADVRDEITNSKAEITADGELGASGFYFEYGEENIRGRIEISGEVRKSDYYELSATLTETSASEKQPLSIRARESRGPAGTFYVVPFMADGPRASARDLHDVGVRAIKESTERIRRKLLADRSRHASVIQSLEYAEVYAWKQMPPEIRPLFKEATGEEWETPAEYEQYGAVYFLNDVALRMYRDAGETFEVLKTISAEEMPETAGRSLGGPYLARGE